VKKYIAILILIVLSAESFAQQRDEPTALGEEASMKAEMALIEGQKHLILENYAKALEMFHVAREINPNDGAIHFKIAEVLFRNKALTDASESIELAIELDSENKFYYLLAADIYTANSDLASAQKMYEELLKMEGNEDYLVELALIFEYQGKYNKALEIYGKAQEHFGINEAMVLQKQEIYFRLGDPQAAIAEWENLTEAYPDEESYIFSLVELLINQGDLASAEMHLKTLLDKNQKNRRASLMIAEILKNQGRIDEAMDHAQVPLLSPELSFNLKGGILNDFLGQITGESVVKFKTLAQGVAGVHPKEYTAQAFAGDVLYQLGDKPNARVFYVKAIKISPNNFSVWQNILSIESELGMLDSLTAHAEEALEYFPNQAAIYYLGGSGYLMKKDYQQSIQLLEIGKRYASNKRMKSVFNGQLGDAYNGLKNYSKSDAAYEVALSSDDTNEHVLNNYSYFLTLRKTKLDKALEMSTRLIQLRPNTATYLDTHGWVLFVQGKYKEAKKHLQKAASLGNDGTVFEHYGDVLYKLGDQEGALVQWEKAATTNDASDLVHKKIADKKFYE